MAQPQKFPPDINQPFVTHLIELRTRLLRILAVITVIFLCLFPFDEQLYNLLAQPLIAHLPEGSTMIATDVAAPFLAPFKFALITAFFLSIPMVLHQIWGFIAPGLYKTERRVVMPLLISSSLLFYAGIAFAYLVVFPLMFAFFIGVAPEGVTVMTDISKYLDFVLKLFFAFGLTFEIPVVTVVLVWAGVTTTEALVSKRSYVIVGAFVVGMLLTPPDMISQTLLAVPMWLLFEVGVVFSRFVSKPEEEDESTVESGASDVVNDEAAKS